MKSKTIRSNFTLFITFILMLFFNLTVEAQLGKQQGLIDPNIASKKQLASVPHLDSKLVDRILKNRPFDSIIEFNQLLSSSISAEQIKEAYSKVFIHVNLNQASEKEILLIPGVGKRMAHEFEEYRPYKSFKQFRREIGKYVDKKEVARLEQYVFIPINLNTADDAAILSIPGLGKKMLHEFKEYRPYRNMEQFRREIGKYVSKKEVARFERYVSLK